jgi:hypothetical protein
MTALVNTIITALIIMRVLTFVNFWTLDNVERDGVRTFALATYCIGFLIAAIAVVIEVIRYSLG